MKRKLALALGALLLLAGCAAAPAEESPAAGQTGGTDGELRELNVVLDWYPNALHAFLYEAIEKGYYAEEGLQVNIQFPLQHQRRHLPGGRRPGGDRPCTTSRT